MKTQVRHFSLVMLYIFFNCFALKAQNLETIKSVEIEKKNEAEKLLESQGLKSKYFVDNELVEVQYLDQNRNPVFYKLYNADASRLTNINSVKRNGRLGLNLSGRNVKIAVWDGGSVLQSHQELSGRTTGGDSPENLSNHATHVTGTIIGAGVNASAEGMATSGIIKYYDFNQDNSEMIKAAEDGVIVSNHSYGEVLGWNYNGSAWQWFGDSDISETEDYRFGSYNSSSQLWDDIAHSNPYYLIVKSAGNDRSDAGNGTGAPADGPFDSIGPKGCAKNILTVGAVMKASNFNNPQDIEITSFSSWGPTDDGRIKPDIVGVGQGLLSASSAGEDQYASLSGTSMSAPNVTGGLALLQELYFNMNSKYMLSATLKGLVIHTAKSTGTKIGPDYQFGWGLLDVAAASELLLKLDDNNRIIESSITSSMDEVVHLIQADSGDLITSTLSWTDLPGSTINSDTLNPTDLRLVNDLDTRLYFNGSEVAFPYVMNPESKSQSTGDNFRDNVEKIHFTAVESGTYELKISHKGLANDQDQTYSLTISSENSESNVNTMILSSVNDDWNDLSNWKNFDESAVQSLPNGNTVVLIDNFEGEAVRLNSDLEVFSIGALDGSSFELDLNGHTLSLNSISLNQEGQIIKNGVIAMKSAYSSSIINGNESFQDIVLQVDKDDDKSVNLIGKLKFSKIEVINGLIGSNESDLEIDSLVLSENVSLRFSNLSLTINNLFEAASDDLVFEASNIIFPTDNAHVNANINNDDGSIEFKGSNFQVTGDFIASDFRVDGLLNYAGSLEIDNFLIYDSSQINFTSGSNVLVNSNFEVLDSLNNRNGAVIESTDAKSFIESNGANKLCFSDLSVINVDAIGSTKLVLDENSTSVNAEGWILQSCENVLDAKFTYEFSCANGVTKFYNTSDGVNITSYQWEFELDGDIISVEDENPEIEFSKTGIVNVFFTINTSDEVSTFTREINVVQSNIAKPSIVLENNILSSTRFSDNYQWYFDGLPIENSNSPSIPIGDMSGEFQVEIYNGRCLMRSDVFEFIVTGNAESLEDVVKIYPNPTNGVFKVQSQVNLEIQGVYSLTGESIEFKVSHLSNSLQEVSIDGKEGVFFILFRTSDRNYMKKLMVLE
ncbi:S8 family serine peptidase [uncultured Marivirga sp.]|uniref:S8 family serine peptidase n=1 Tax=uncultured Marivirga sp. TaxID=1123707 RepID=UPI0030EF2562|tara:strand:+ start:71661 stop:75023 length:3363 start_codon:yes stop_codon:yes gene_type:complete